mgnify:CR=1 FL=1
MISKANMEKIKKCFSNQDLNINKIRSDLKIKRGNNTLRDFILGLSDDPGTMALEKMADYANMDFVLVPIKRLERLDTVSKNLEQDFIRSIDERYDELSLILSQLTSLCPKKISTKKEPTFKRNIDLSNSNVVMNSIVNSSTEFAQSLDDIFNAPIDIGALTRDNF